MLRTYVRTRICTSHMSCLWLCMCARACARVHLECMGMSENRVRECKYARTYVCADVPTSMRGGAGVRLRSKDMCPQPSIGSGVLCVRT